MSNIQKVLNYIEFFEHLKKKVSGCGKKWCSTCGGYVYGITRILSQNDKTELTDLLTQVTDNEYELFSEWHDVLSELFPDIVNEKQNRIDKKDELLSFERINQEIDSIDITDIKEVEKYLYYNRYNYINYAIKRPNIDSYYFYDPEYYYPFRDNYYLIEREEREKFQDKYANLLDIAINSAIETKDYSLIESLAIILKTELNKYPELIDLFLEKCTNKLVYNCLGIDRELNKQ